MVVRRTLLIAGGGGSFVAPGPFVPEAFDVTSPPAGGWVWFGANRAIRNGAETIVGFDEDADVKAIRIDNATRTVVQTATLYDNFLDDDHQPPSFVVRPDGIIMSAFAYHVGDLYVGIGPSAGVLPSQANVTNISSQTGDVEQDVFGYTYASIVYLPGEDRYYIFARYHDETADAGLVYTYSDDDGATWAPHTLVAGQTYHQLAVNGSDRIDFVLSDHPLYGTDDDPDVPTSIYHAYFTGGSWFESDGTPLTTRFGATEGGLVYNGDPDRGWLWDIAIGDDGHPRIVYLVQDDPFPTGPWSYHWARWTGSAWEDHYVADAGGEITVGASPEHGGTTYAGGIVLDHENANRVYYSSDAGGSFQLYTATTADDGATWTPAAITADADKNVRPVSVVGHDGGNVQALVLYGTYNDYFDYSQGIKVVGTP